MKRKPLKTYLRTIRRRCGLSQSDLGFLLGGMGGRTVRRHERGEIAPSMRTILIYEFVLGMELRNIVEGEFVTIVAELEPRVRGLIRSTQRQRRSPLRDKKIAHLRRLLKSETPESVA